mgnify:CR=1 FL=1|nr:MAG TPA: tail protein [Caudoviricetes sp.]
MIDIKDISGKTLLSVPITQECRMYSELMSKSYIQLSWNSNKHDELEAGAFITVGGKKFKLLEPYQPDMSDEVECKYSPLFYDEVAEWSKKPFFFVSDNTEETDWGLTAYPGQFMERVVAALKKYTGSSYTFSVDSSIADEKMEYLSFQNVSIFDALGMIADAFDTEWWVDGTTIHLSKCQYGSEITLEVGRNIGSPFITKNKSGYYTRFYAFGSTRNITQDYNDSGFTNGLVNKRLTLNPDVYPGGYIDIRDNLNKEEVFVKTLIFDDIYPSSKLAISSVSAQLNDLRDSEGDKIQAGVDSGGNPIYKQYAIWKFKIPGFTLNNTTYDKVDNPDGMLLPGLELSASFESGQLNGRDFKLTYHEDTQEYEINFVEENGIIVPGTTSIIPSDGDMVVLYNIKMPHEYVSSAQAELAQELLKEIGKRQQDRDSYTFQSNPVAFKSGNIDIEVGRSVLYKCGSKTLSTRVLKVEKQLDYPTEQTITIGEEKIKGNTTEIKEEVINANQSIDEVKALADLNKSIQDGYGRVQRLIMESLSKYKGLFTLNKHGYPDDPDRWTVDTDYTLFAKRDVIANSSGDVPEESLPVASDYTTTGLFRAKQGGGLLYDTNTNGWYVNPDFAGGGVNFTVGKGLQMSASNELSVKYGTIAGTACQGNDSRLSNARKNPYKLLWNGGEYDGGAEKTLPSFLTVNDLSGYVKKTGDDMSGPLLMTLTRLGSTYKIYIGANTSGEKNPYISIFGNTYAKLHVNQGSSDTSKWTDYGSTTLICSGDYLIRTSNTASNDFKFTGKNFTAPGDIVANSTTTAFTGAVPVADNATYGLVKYDNLTIKKNSSGQLYCTVQGGGSTGVVKYWRPSVNTNGVLSWTLSESESTPSSVNIKGPKGDPGATGAKGQGVTYQWSGTQLRLGTINSSGNTSWGSYVDLKGPKGDPGSGGGSSSWNGGTVTNPIIAKASNSTQARIYGNDISTYSPISYNQRLWLNYTCRSSNAEIYIGNGDNKGTQVATINSGGNGKILTQNGTGSLSDKRIKTIFERKEDILGKIQCINVYEYTRVDDENKILRVGVIAQEVAKTFPTIAVRDFVDDTNNEQYYTVDYATLGAVVAIGGCKELYAKYKEQQQTIDNLQSKLALLMQEVEKMKGGAV